MCINKQIYELCVFSYIYIYTHTRVPVCVCVVFPASDHVECVLLLLRCGVVGRLLALDVGSTMYYYVFGGLRIQYANP